MVTGWEPPSTARTLTEKLSSLSSQCGNQTSATLLGPRRAGPRTNHYCVPESSRNHSNTSTRTMGITNVYHRTCLVTFEHGGDSDVHCFLVKINGINVLRLPRDWTTSVSAPVLFFLVFYCVGRQKDARKRWQVAAGRNNCELIAVVIRFKTKC